MAKVLCVWEMGSSLGHLANLRQSIEVLVNLGHTVYLASRELQNIKSVLLNLPIKYLQAPFKFGNKLVNASEMLSFTSLIKYQCFETSEDLEYLIKAWRVIFDLVDPSLVLFEHSPTALIAATDYKFKKVVLGSGFFIPPEAKVGEPFAPFPNTSKDNYLELLKNDIGLLEVINRTLAELTSSELNSLNDIYSNVTTKLFTTIPLLDHFGTRNNSNYIGTEALKNCAKPVWPSHQGKKVFAYLNNMVSIELLLYALQSSNNCVLIYSRSIPEVLRKKYSSNSMQFTTTLVDLDEVAKDVDWVINNANHSTIISFLLRGIPQFMLPIYQEQYFLSLKVLDQECGINAYTNQNSYFNEISRMNNDQSLKLNAKLAQSTIKAIENPYNFLYSTYTELLAA